MPWNVDALDVWKIASIAVTGSFGVLGLFTEYKHPESKKVTRWGYISLTGIIFSTVAGVAAQTVEVSRAKESEISDTKRSLELANSTSTAVKNTSLAVAQIQRVLSPLGASTMILEYDVPCQRDAKYATFCRNFWKNNRHTISKVTNWPGGRPAGLSLSVSYQPDKMSHMATQYDGKVIRLSDKDSYLFGYSGDDENHSQLAFLVHVKLIPGDRQDITIKSTYDLLKGPVFLWVDGFGYRDLILSKVYWRSERGDTLESIGGPFVGSIEEGDDVIQYDMRFKVSEEEQLPD